MKNILYSILFIGLSSTALAQSQPKLVVGIVVDQMRQDYLYRYWEKFGDAGFKRLINEGHMCKNAHFNYIPTYTGPGHASVYTGTTPMGHGIIANNWYDKSTGESVYCVSDSTQSTVGAEGEVGKMSPARMLAPTLGDAIRIANQFKGKSIGISLKDRSAILPIGHSGNAAYWMDYETGAFVTSTYYMEKLPKWMVAFNRQKHADKLSENGWDPLLAIERYTESTADDTPYEKVLNPNGKPVFPYDLASLNKDKGYYAFATSPYGNTILRLLADQAIVHEDLGQDEFMDMLSISFSTPDLAGHSFGPQSIEVEDIYIRLDEEIAQLLSSLDERVGKGEYLLFLTADHAAAQVPAYMKDNKIPMDYFDGTAFLSGLKAHLNETLGEGEWVLSYSNQQVFLNHDLIRSQRFEAKKAMEEVERFALAYKGVAGVLSTKQLQHPLPEDGFSSAAKMGWNQLRSGDVVIQYLPGWMQYGEQGTTHGTSYNYDSHVPMIFYGAGIIPGTTLDPVTITQIAPTISLATSIAFPEMSDHKVVTGALRP
ncbi:MAG: alkaline phosphatase family protein [Cryomorphaceae bacterium]